MREIASSEGLVRLVQKCFGVVLFYLLLFCAGASSYAQDSDLDLAPSPIAIEGTADKAIAARLEGIYSQIESLSDLQVRVAEGVVTLEGMTVDPASTVDAIDIARRVEGVVYVLDRTQPSLDVGDKISPFLSRLLGMFSAARNAAPLILVAAILLLLVAAFFWWVGSWQAFWRRLSPNTFVAELVSQAVRVVGIVLALVLALNLTGAGALLGTVVGAAGVIGLAIGIAVRDSLENYISSIMLSLRQPFRANDHVVIDDQEGKVVRLTSRATILMNLDGNHLRIPNAAVFKAVILNYTRNPERRFTFQLGVDAADDPQAAIDVGTTALATLEFVLGDPQPRGIIESVGDSNIMLTFHGWINQVDSDFLQARSAAIRVVKSAIEEAGFTLPEPIYRLRFDQLPEEMRSVNVKGVDGPVRSAGSKRSHVPVTTASVRPQTEIDDKIAAERADAGREDLLDPEKPVE